ncbi:MAG: phosphosulfolactate synthase [Candidatus Gracilibacteria bacterium]
MRIDLDHIPDRPEKPRTRGLTMVMDKGMSIRETEDFLSMAREWTDLVKLAWGSVLLTRETLRDKLRLYTQSTVQAFPGGVLFEAYAARGQIEAYAALIKELGLNVIEISTSVIDLDPLEKCRLIERFAKGHTVLSEVGSRVQGKEIPDEKLPELIGNELAAGAFKVIVEGGSSGSTGVYRDSTTVSGDLMARILERVPQDQILWEAPRREQQVDLIRRCGPNVNLGNIEPREVIGLEAWRLGLRADTLSLVLPH